MQEVKQDTHTAVQLHASPLFISPDHFQRWHSPSLQYTEHMGTLQHNPQEEVLLEKAEGRICWFSRCNLLLSFCCISCWPKPKHSSQAAGVLSHDFFYAFLFSFFLLNAGEWQKCLPLVPLWTGISVSERR